MKQKKLIKLILLFAIVFNQWNDLLSQNSQVSDSEYDENADYDNHDEAIFNNDPIFENYGFFQDRNSTEDPVNPPQVYNGPIDGGITWVIGGIVGYGLTRIRKSKKSKNEPDC